MSSGKVHRRISRAIATPTAIATGLVTDDWFVALLAGVICALSGCGPDNSDQAEARLSIGWETLGCAAWIVIVSLLLYWLKDAPTP